MERNEMIEVLMGKANVSAQEAQEALEACSWDLLDAIIYLERKGKVENNETTTIIQVEEKKEKSKDHKDTFGGIGDIIGRMFKFVGRFIKKGNETYLEVRKENEKPIRISITILILLIIFLSVPTVVLLVIGLFSGYKYSISSKDMNFNSVNNVFEEVSKSAESIKKDFKESYEN